MTKKDILKIDDSVSDVSVENVTEKKTDDKRWKNTIRFQGRNCGQCKRTDTGRD